MPAFYRATLREFLHTSSSELNGRLASAYAGDGFSALRSSQIEVWIKDIDRLRRCLDDLLRASPAASGWSVLLEFPIPRKEKRIDVVLLAGTTIVLLELKSGDHGSESLRQAEEYALLLHYFHEPSSRRHLMPLVVCPTRTSRPTTQHFLPLVEAPRFWIAPVQQLGWHDLSRHLCGIQTPPADVWIDPETWDRGEYRPVPTIIQAALSLQTGLETIREIAHARAARHDVDQLTTFVRDRIAAAKAAGSFVICFVTGVPGSGKTLVGLNLAFDSSSAHDPIHFMSGTGPLVKVLQAALAEDHRHRSGVTAGAARMHAKTLIENVHVFAKTYTEDKLDRAPSNHVIIFDEAQRAWDRAQNMSKFKRDYSEPEMLLKIMQRHHDWAVVIALVGGGQEINSGEAGLSEWGRAPSATGKPWHVFASPESLQGGQAVAGSKLFEQASLPPDRIFAEPQLHLDVSVRSLNAESYSAWANYVVRGEAEAAGALRAQDHFPILLTRSMTDLRLLLQQNTLGESRCGLVASSKATRLRAEGLEPDSSFHAEYDWDRWYLAPATDVRSSSQLEVFASEFEIQGLELDWIGLCWGGDFVWSNAQRQWLIRSFSHKRASSWSTIRQEVRRVYRRNAYRVLLTRARQGIVLFVPAGDTKDATRSPKEFDETADYLLACGAQLASPLDAPEASSVDTRTLFD